MTPDFLSAAADALVLSLPEPVEPEIVWAEALAALPENGKPACDSDDDDDDACSFCNGTGFNDGVGCEDCLTEECDDCKCTIKQIEVVTCEWCDGCFCEDCFLNDDSDYHQIQVEESICKKCLELYAEELADRLNKVAR